MTPRRLVIRAPRPVHFLAAVVIIHREDAGGSGQNTYPHHSAFMSVLRYPHLIQVPDPGVDMPRHRTVERQKHAGDVTMSYRGAQSFMRTDPRPAASKAELDAMEAMGGGSGGPAFAFAFA